MPAYVVSAPRPVACARKVGQLSVNILGESIETEKYPGLSIKGWHLKKYDIRQ